jgi:hypothetical protein
VSLQGHACHQARALLSSQLHPKEQEQQQVRQERGFAYRAQAAQELRAYEATDGEMDRLGTVQLMMQLTKTHVQPAPKKR